MCSTIHKRKKKEKERKETPYEKKEGKGNDTANSMEIGFVAFSSRESVFNRLISRINP